MVDKDILLCPFTVLVFIAHLAAGRSRLGSSVHQISCSAVSVRPIVHWTFSCESFYGSSVVETLVILIEHLLLEIHHM